MHPLMSKHLYVALACAVGLFSATPAQSQDYKDWSVACDNILHCEAAGTQTEDGDSDPVSLWLARDAGPGTPLKAKIAVQRDDDVPIGTLTLKIGKFVLRGLEADAELSPAQASALLAHALEADNAEISDGKTRWTLSFAGLKAALLKIDDVQGRIGTPGALLRRGNKPEASVPPPKPVPTVRAAAVPKGIAPSDKVLDAILNEAKKSGDACFEDLPDDQDPAASIQAISATQVLVIRDCWRAAYQSGIGVWIANAKPPYRPKRVRFPVPGGTPEDTVSNGEFDGVTMQGYGKGRGLFDCGAGWTWVWTGAQFELTEAWSGPLCRGMPGGGTQLRTWIANVVK